MPRTVSAAFEAAIYGQETNEVFLALLKIDHDDWLQPLYLTSDGVDTIRPPSPDVPVDSSSFTASYTGEVALTDTQWIAGTVGQGALRFDGSTAKMVMDYDPTKPCDITSSALTIELKVKLQEWNTIFFSKGDQYKIGTDSAGYLQVAVDTAGGWNWVVTETILTLDTWFHIAYTYDGSAIRVYVDGAFVWAEQPTNTGAIVASAEDLVIGAEGDPATAWTECDIDETRIWEIVRTQREINTWKDVALSDVADTDLKVNWRLEDPDVYLAYPFHLKLAQDTDQSFPKASVSIDNADLSVLTLLRSITTPPTATIQIILASDPSVLEAEFVGFELRDIGYSEGSINGSLVLEDIMQEPYPSNLVTPDRFPGLWS